MCDELARTQPRYRFDREHLGESCHVTSKRRRSSITQCKSSNYQRSRKLCIDLLSKPSVFCYSWKYRVIELMIHNGNTRDYKGFSCFLKCMHFIFVQKLLRHHNLDFIKIIYYFSFNDLFPNSKYEFVIQLFWYSKYLKAMWCTSFILYIYKKISFCINFYIALLSCMKEIVKIDNNITFTIENILRYYAL